MPTPWTDYMDGLTPADLKAAALAEAKALGRDDLVKWIEGRDDV